MIKELERLYHRYDEQKKVYAKYSSKLSKSEKYSLIYEFLNNKRDFWGYFQLICDIALEISDNSDRFIKLLTDIDNKVKNDMAQKPFMDLLIKLGSKDFSLNLYNEVIKNTQLDENLRIISGLILGGVNSKSEIEKRLKQKIKYPLTNSYLKAILVYYDDKKLNKTVYDFFDKIIKTQNVKILPELAFTSYKLYNKNSKYFYQIIKKMLKLNDNSINWTIYSRLSYDNKFTKDQFFELIEEAKDSDIRIIDEIIQAFKQYPKEHKRIVDLFIYWMNKLDKFEFDSRNFRWVLEDLVKQNKFFIKEFFNRYEEIQPDKKIYLFTFPHIFEILSKYHQDYALNQILNMKKVMEDNKILFFKLCEVFIGNIYTNQANKDLCIKLNNKLIELADKTDFVHYNKKTYSNKLSKIKQNNSLSKDDYNYLIDFSKDLIRQLRDSKSYNFNLIKENLSKYKTVNELIKKIIEYSEKNKVYTPLLWLGEKEEPKLDDIDIKKDEDELSKAMKISYARSQFWSRAYLKELDSSLKKYLELKNEKYITEKRLKKSILDNLSNEHDFWNFESELIFINRFPKRIILKTEPNVPNRPKNNLDLKINLFKKDIYFEVTRPKMYRNLNLSNGALAIPNKAMHTIKSKFKNQITSDITLKEMKKAKRSDLFFIVIDISGSTIDDYQIMNAFYGSLSLTLVMDKKKGKVVNQYPSRKDDSIHKINKNTDIVSGVIYFKQELMFDEHNRPFIKLKGDIIQNPNGINLLNEKELKKLKKMIFD